MDLQYFASKYVWWQAPETALTDPHRGISQVMNLGTLEDVRELRRQVDCRALSDSCGRGSRR